MTENTRFSPETRRQVVHMVLDSLSKYNSQWAVFTSIVPKTGCTPDTLRIWIHLHNRKR